MLLDLLSLGSQVRQELPQVERRLGLADRVQVHESAACAVEEQLFVLEIAVAETQLQWLGLLGKSRDPLQPGLRPVAEARRELPGHCDLALQAGELVVERAEAAKFDAG